MHVIPSPELPAGRRSALLIGSGRFEDEELTDLRAPACDVDALAAVLGDAGLGRFAVTSKIDASVQQLRIETERFLRKCTNDELIVVYLSCHGLLDRSGNLFFAATDTRRELLAATGLEARWLRDRLEQCPARRQVIILDCCFSGAFVGSKAADDPKVGAYLVAGSGRGRAVLSASRAFEYSFEQDTAARQGAKAPGSLFSAALIEGLSEGRADEDGDGFVSVFEAYAYAEKRLREGGAAQTPQLSLERGEGKIFLTRNPNGVRIEPAALPGEIKAGLESQYVGLRLGAVTELSEWLSAADPARRLAADIALRRVAQHDSPRVAQAARTALEQRAATPSLPVRHPRVGTSSVGETVATGNSTQPTLPDNHVASGRPIPVLPRRSMREMELLTAAREVERWRGQPSATRISRELGIGMPLATSLANAIREELGAEEAAVPNNDAARATHSAQTAPGDRSLPRRDSRADRENKLLLAAREVERWRGQPSATRISRELGVGMPLATSLANAIRYEEYDRGGSALSSNGASTEPIRV